jgi:polyphenol oxidase
MLVTAHNNVSIYFGDGVSDTVNHKSLSFKNFCEKLTDTFNLNHLTLLHQVHGTDGMMINQQDVSQKIKLFEQDGDWLITNQKNVAIGILTADCLPIILYDTVQQAVGIAHAGWKGTFAGIAQKLLEEMEKKLRSKRTDLRVVFGPSARSCCYEVGKEFENYIPDDELLKKNFIKRDSKFFFNKSGYNATQLKKAGITQEALSFEYNVCTICNYAFHSHRRGIALRQMTLVFLR